MRMDLKILNASRIIAVLIIAISFQCGKIFAGSVNCDSLAQRLMYQVWAFPQEKVYMVTDRDAYVSGDTVRFRAFLVNASTHAKPQNGSKFIYVELTNPFGETVKRVKIKQQDDAFAGIIPIEEETPEGFYTLTAYTQFMQNSGSDYFFRKSLPILSNLSQKYSLTADFDGYKMTATLRDKFSKKPVRAEAISIYGLDEIVFEQGIRHRSSHTTTITRKMFECGIVKLIFDRYEKFVALPQDTRNISLTFHPEGGYLIPDQKNLLAFKAIDRKGLSVDFNGTIIDEDGRNAAVITSLHNGMGSIQFTPQQGKNYFAMVNGEKFPLPLANDSASVLSVSSLDNDSILVKVVGNKRERLSLIAHNGGNVSLAMPLDKSEIILDKNQLGSGIVQLLLVDSDGNTLSSRMIFNHSGYVYNDINDSVPEGDYAIRALHGGLEQPSSSIVSNLLLQSELKGYIEDADYYFRNRDSKTDSDLDLVMLTHGWERYDIPAAFKKKFSFPQNPIEIGGEISGVVKSRWRGKPLEDAIVMLISPKLDYAAQTFTDSEGKFTFNGLDWPEKTPFILQAFNSKGDKEHNFDIDEEQYPFIYLVGSNSELNEIEYDYSLLAAGTTLLEELEVTAPRSLEESRREMMKALGVKSFTFDEIEEMRVTSYEELIRKIPGLRIVDGNVLSTRARGIYNMGLGGTPVEFWVDGTRWNSSISSISGSLSTAHASGPSKIGGEMLPEHTLTDNMSNTLFEFSGMYPISIVKSIEYFQPSVAMVISQSAAYGGGALVITTKDGSERVKEWDDDLFMKVIRPLGYQKPAESYEPHYYYDPTSDSGVYNAAWIPMANGSELSGIQDDCSVIVEGITQGFIPVFYHINRKNH